MSALAHDDAARPATAGGEVYRAFWRWHFYAGLLVMPVLMLMALTGGLYLYKDRIEAALYRDLLDVPVQAAAVRPQAWADAAAAHVGGRPVQLAPPEAPGRSAKVVVAGEDGVRTAVFVDPHDARILGAIPEGGVMKTVQRLHSLDLVGPWANYLVEIVAGWAIVMVATGLVLWWPRGQAGGVVRVRGRPSRRVFWRDLHAVTGVFLGGVVAFLAVTGMPWSAFWGAQARGIVNAAGWGRPPAPAAAEAWSHDPAHADHGPQAWALSGSALHAAHGQDGLSIDAAVEGVEAAGLPRPYVLTIPTEPGKAWTASHQARQVAQIRTLYLDPASGMAMADVAYDRFGPGAKVIEWGVAVHEGRQYGEANRALVLAACLAVWVLGLSSLVMWWKRRPMGRLAAPPPPADRRAWIPLAAVVTPLALLFPLVGASLVLVLGGDLLVRRLSRKVAAAAGAR